MRWHSLYIPLISNEVLFEALLSLRDRESTRPYFCNLIILRRAANALVK